MVNLTLELQLSEEQIGLLNHKARMRGLTLAEFLEPLVAEFLDGEAKPSHGIFPPSDTSMPDFREVRESWMKGRLERWDKIERDATAEIEE